MEHYYERYENFYGCFIVDNWTVSGGHSSRIKFFDLEKSCTSRARFWGNDHRYDGDQKSIQSHSFYNFWSTLTDINLVSIVNGLQNFKDQLF